MMQLSNQHKITTTYNTDDFMQYEHSVRTFDSTDWKTEKISQSLRVAITCWNKRIVPINMSNKEAVINIEKQCLSLNI